MKRVLIYLFPLILIYPLYGENILGSMAGIIQVIDDGESTPLELGLEDLAALDFLFDNPFVQGVEIQVDVPPSVQNFPYSFALYLYNTLQPVPEIDKTSYRGHQFFMQILPPQPNFSIKIPFLKENTLTKDADSVVTGVVSLDDFPIMTTMLPISKGLPKAAKEGAVSITARPLFFNRGGLKIAINHDEEIREGDIRIKIDDNGVNWPEEYYTLTPGFHRVSIQFGDGGERITNVAIERGRFTRLEHQIESARTSVIIKPVPGATILLDGKEIDSSELNVPLRINPGNHKVEFSLNDDLSITKEFKANRAESISISLDNQILIEND